MTNPEPEIEGQQTIPFDNPTVDLAEEWMKTRQSILWGRHFDIVDHPREAAEWFAEELTLFTAFVHNKYGTIEF